MVRISFFVYCLSNLVATTHSFTFCRTLKNGFLDFLPVNNILANCCVMVLAPPLPGFKTALAVPLKSIPECS